MKINDWIGKEHNNPLSQYTNAINVLYIDGVEGNTYSL